jgi:RNA recognition motif-containing protein
MEVGEVVHTKTKPAAAEGYNEFSSGNLSYNTTEESLQAFFETYGILFQSQNFNK